MSRRLVYATTDPASARYLLRGQLAHMRQAGFDVTVIASPGADLEYVKRVEGVAIAAVPMTRAITPLEDLVALLRLIRIVHRLRPDIVNASTPKAGLLGMIAATVTRVPVRIYTLRGLRSETTRGLKRVVLEIMERIASGLAHRVLAVSFSLRDEYVRRGLCRPDKLVVLGDGSSNGIEIERYPASRTDIESTRRQLSLEQNETVIGFIGRLVRDKGVEQLVDAFDILRKRGRVVRLVIVGRIESGDALPSRVLDRIGRGDGIIRVDHVDDTRPYYGVFDVLAFPSFREGFPNVPLEAASSSVPVVGFRTTGTMDAVVNGETGALVTPGDSAGLADALQRYIDDPDLRRRHGENARRRVEAKFSNRRIWSELESMYRSTASNETEGLAPRHQGND